MEIKVNKLGYVSGFLVGALALVAQGDGVWADGKEDQDLKKDREVATAKQTLTEAQQIAAIHIPWEEQRKLNLTENDVRLIAGADSLDGQGIVLVYHANGKQSENQDIITRDDFDASDGAIYKEANEAMQTLKFKGLTVNKITLADSYDGHDNIVVYYNGLPLFIQPIGKYGAYGLKDALIDGIEEEVEKLKDHEIGRVSSLSGSDKLALAND